MTSLIPTAGHCHPKVSKAAADQCMKLVHGQVGNGVLINLDLDLLYGVIVLNCLSCSIPTTHQEATYRDAWSVGVCESRSSSLDILQDPSLDTFFFWNSGTEAVEQSIKIARTTTKRQNIIAMQGAYHGRTIGSLSLTRSKTIYGEGASPVMVRSAHLSPNLLTGLCISPELSLRRSLTGTNSVCRLTHQRQRSSHWPYTSLISSSRSRLLPRKQQQSSSSPCWVREVTSPLLRRSSQHSVPPATSMVSSSSSMRSKAASDVAGSILHASGVGLGQTSWYLRRGSQMGSH